ncbi:MAG: phosphate uptake regulator PhoU [Thermofilaceae archaeon]
METREVTRRVQLIGRSTYVVSLPKNWAKRVGIGRGSPVTIVLEPDGSLRLVPPPLQEGKRPECKMVIRDGESEGTIIREIMSRYLVGYKVIRVELPPDGKRFKDVIKRIISNKMIGVELLEDGEHSIVLQVLVNVEELPVNLVIQRMGQVGAGMIDDSMEGLFARNITLLEDVISRDDFIDKLYLYLLRQLNAGVRGFVGIEEIGLKSLEEIIEYAVVGKSVERCADHAEKIARNAKSLVTAGVSISGLERELESMTKLAKEIFQNSIRCFLNREREKALSLLDEYPPRLAAAEQGFIERILEEPCDARRHMVIRLIADSLRRICDYSMDVLEATIDLSLE